MTLNEYQNKAHEFACYMDDYYPWFALIEEIGELYTHIAKLLRGDYAYLDKTAIKKELGDCLWQFQEVCSSLGFTLQDIAELNIDKLEDRKQRDKIRGSGDER